MTDLRTAAQAVLNACDKCVLRKEQIEALRQALATPVEPVAWQYRVVFRLTGEDSFRHGRWHECRDKAEYDDYKSRHWFEVRELYTTPPSVLIAEAVAKEREACAQIADGFYGHIRQYTTDVPEIGFAIRARGQK